MNWFFAVLPLLALVVASATIPRMVPAVRHQRSVLADDRLRADGPRRLSSNGHGHLSAGTGSVGTRR